MRKKGKQHTSWQDKAAARVAKKIISAQVCISRRLQKVEQRLSVKQKKIGLVIFCLISSVYLLYLLGNALLIKHTSRYPQILPKQGISIPLPDSGRPQDTSTEPFIHQKKHKQ